MVAKKLNQTRIRDTKYALIFCLALVLFTKEMIATNWGEGWHEIFDMLGYLLVSLCVIGRIYCTAFLGGYKNAELVTHGPFSMSRNPLYFCSFLGACGIALMSNHIVLMVALPLLFCVVYFSLIRREEAYLVTQFGDSYQRYCKTTPRFSPNFWRYHAPQTVPMYPKYLLNGIKDGLLWFLALPFFEWVEYLHEAQIIKPIFTLY